MHRSARTSKGPTSVIPVLSSTAGSIRHQLYQGLRKAIVSGQLAGGARLPSTRSLATELAISRTTVVMTYEQLLLEGYLEGHPRSGTYVAHTLPDELLSTTQRPAQRTPTAVASPASSRLQPAKTLAGAVSFASSASFTSFSAPDPTDPNAPTAFCVGQPALDAFPQFLWQKLLYRHVRMTWPDHLAAQSAAGYQPLREAIAGYLATARGVRCTAEQVIVTTGCYQSLDVLLRVLAHAEDTIWMEDPGCQESFRAFQDAGLRVIPVPVDSDGLDVAAAQALAPDARFAFVMPSHQFPLGVTMSMERRLALLEWARQHEGWIIEDEYDCDYRYVGRPLPSLQGLDEAGRVLYVGTFSLALFPSVHLGYLVVPPALAETFHATCDEWDHSAPLLEQAVVADFINEGHFQRHLRRMRTLYAERQELLRKAIAKTCAGLLDVAPDPAGTHLLAWLPEDVEAAQAAQITHEAAEDGVQVASLAQFSRRPLSRNALLLGYAAADERVIADGVQVLAKILQGSQTRRSRSLAVR